MIMKQEITIDVRGKSLGRAASEVAFNLRGKGRPDFVPHKVLPVKVKVKNVAQIKVTGKKMQNKKYKRFSGYPSGLKEIPMEKVFNKSPQEVFKKAVRGMLPNNKLRKDYLKNLSFE